jgi:hypothetical protein
MIVQAGRASSRHLYSRWAPSAGPMNVTMMMVIGR